MEVEINYIYGINCFIENLHKFLLFLLFTHMQQHNLICTMGFVWIKWDLLNFYKKKLCHFESLLNMCVTDVVAICSEKKKWICDDCCDNFFSKNNPIH